MKVSLLAVLWILTVAFGYLLGLRDRPDPVALPALTQQSSKISLNNPVEVMGTKKKKSVDPTVEVKRIELVEEAASEPKSDFPRVIEEVSDTFEKMRSNNPLIRLQAFSELLQKNDEDSIRQAIAAYEELPEGSSRFSELRMLAYSWAQIDPIGAVEWMNELDGLEKRIGMGTVLDSWARTDSETAIAWAKENFDGEEGQENPYLIGIVSGMSQNDLVGATELMTSMPNGRARGRSASIIFEQTWKKGEEVAMNWAENLPEGSHEQYTKDRLKGWESKSNVFDSDADIVDHQVAIIEYANKAVLSFHTNMKVPDEFRRFAVIGSAGMIEGDFVKGFMKAHDENNNVLIDEDYGAAFGKEIKGHYGADSMMAQDINNYLLKNNKELPVGVIECMEAGIVAMKIDEARNTGKVIDLTSTWDKFDSLLN